MTRGGLERPGNDAVPGLGDMAGQEPADPRRRIDDVADEITCLIADDHEVVREGLRLALSRSPRIRVIGEAIDGASAVALT
ncbi:MAG: Response regulator transcription factor [Thermoleophilia bacterium]|nr:Response regulator transcription factor [Thermoleophilia bacterium]